MSDAYSGCCYTRHAEMNAIKHLPVNYSNKKKRTLDFYILRITNNNELRSSKPCSKCIKHMSLLLPRRGFRVRHVYYVTEENVLLKVHFNELLKTY
jgi:deoxycytidylate deaminase